MITNVIALKYGDTMVNAYEKLQGHDIHHLPVVDDAGRLIGIFSSTDLNHVCPARETEEGWYYDKEGLSINLLEHFMTKDPYALTPENTLKEPLRSWRRYALDACRSSRRIAANLSASSRTSMY